MKDGDSRDYSSERHREVIAADRTCESRSGRDRWGSEVAA